MRNKNDEKIDYQRHRTTTVFSPLKSIFLFMFYQGNRLNIFGCQSSLCPSRPWVGEEVLISHFCLKSEIRIDCMNEQMRRWEAEVVNVYHNSVAVLIRVWMSRKSIFDWNF